MTCMTWFIVFIAIAIFGSAIFGAWADNYCPSCSLPRRKDARFCHKCGMKFRLPPRSRAPDVAAPRCHCSSPAPHGKCVCSAQDIMRKIDQPILDPILDTIENQPRDVMPKQNVATEPEPAKKSPELPPPSGCYSCWGGSC